MNLNLIIWIIATVWLLIITGYLIWLYVVFKDLIKISKDKELVNNTKEIKRIWGEVELINKNSRLNIQKVGLVKFNPFKEAGGDHSFSLALLDGNKNGIIITSLHARERTRLYIKDIIKAKAKLELSKEEQDALNLSLR